MQITLAKNIWINNNEECIYQFTTQSLHILADKVQYYSVVILQVTCRKGHVSEGSFVRNVVVQIPKFDAKPNPNPKSNLKPSPKAPNPNLNPSPNPNSNPNPNLSPSPNPNPMPIRFGQMTLRTSELLLYSVTISFPGCRSNRR